MNKIELLAPAGNLEKLKYAIEYGADAVYCGIPDFSLRVRINQFDEKSLQEAVIYAHKQKKKVYVTLNIYAHNQHLSKIEKHLKFLSTLGGSAFGGKIDGVIVSDPGIINLVKKYLPKIDIHLSTQANATNWQAVKFWADQGIKRIILAREVTLAEIKEIKKHNPKVELEYFVHGAMCMSYSGRCILSKWMTNRSANLGDCSQPCRWAYHKTCSMEHEIKNVSLVEDKDRFNLDIEEDRHGTYFFNSYDLNLIGYIDELIKAGITSLKIEGRAKSAFYVAVVTRAYRKVIDAIKSKSKKEMEQVIMDQKKELKKLANRGYTAGFISGKDPDHNFYGKNFGGTFQFIGEILGIDGEYNIVKVHNEVYLNDKIEAVTPEKNIKIKIKKILDNKKNETSDAHGGHDKLYYFEFDKKLRSRSLIRRES
jgi:U32 family peptidase